MNIHESAEDYLERILMLKEEKGYARSIDIANSLSVTKPSVSFAMKRLPHFLTIFKTISYRVHQYLISCGP